MIPATQKKLREAQYFLAQLAAQERIPVSQCEPEVAEFYFNAYVSAARSVTWMLQKEAKEKYDEWFPSWLASRADNERLTLSRFDKERIEIVHRKGADLNTENVLIPVKLRPSSSKVIRPFWAQSSAPETKMGVFRLVCRFAFDNHEASASEAASHNTSILNALVADFERAFA